MTSVPGAWDGVGHLSRTVPDPRTAHDAFREHPHGIRYLYIGQRRADHPGMKPATGRDLHAGLRVSRLPCALVTALGLALVACERPAAPESVAPAKATAGPEITWAASALTRNPDLELLATDTAAGVFTVRIKSTNEVRTLRLTELAAAPISQLTTRPAATIAAADADPPAPATQAAPAQPAHAPVTPEPAATIAAAPPANETRSSTAAANYTIDRADGQVKVSGPGVSIVSAGTASAASVPNEPPGTDTIICEGRRMLQLDNRAIHVTGNAIIARGGCELYITNSRIVAGGTAVIVQDAIVHIANSTIEGSTASLDADDHARLLIRSSTFKGVQRRSARTVLQDQGGNQWR